MQVFSENFAELSSTCETHIAWAGAGQQWEDQCCLLIRNCRLIRSRRPTVLSADRLAATIRRTGSSTMNDSVEPTGSTAILRDESVPEPATADAPAATGRTDRRRLMSRLRLVPGTWLLPGGIATLFGAVYIVLSVARYDRINVASWDLAIFSQAARSYAERGYPIVDVKGPGFNLLGDHFSPVLALFAPLWAAVPSPVTLLVAQAILLSFSVGVVCALAVRHLGRAAGITVGLAYGLSFGIAQAVDFDVHEVSFAVPLLALAGGAYLRRDWSAVCLWSAPLVLVREDQGLTLVAIGLVLVLVGARRWGAGLIVFGVLATVIILLVVIPALNLDGYDYWSRLTGDDKSPGGAEVPEIPLLLRFVWPPEKIETLLITFGVTGFLALRSPWALVAVPTLGWRFFATYDYYWGTDWHYSVTLMPVLFVALVDGLVRARASRPAWLARYAGHGAAVALTVALAFIPQYAFADLYKSQTYADTEQEHAAERVLELVPDGAVVETDIGLMAPLVAGHQVYFYGTNTGPKAVTSEWMVLDPRYSGGQIDIVDWASDRWPGTQWRAHDVGGGYLVAERVG